MNAVSINEATGLPVSPSVSVSPRTLRIRQLNMLETERNGLVNSGRGQEAAEFAKENPGVRMILMGNRAEKEVRDLRTQKRNLMKRNATSDEIKRIDERITERMRRFNEQAASVI